MTTIDRIGTQDAARLYAQSSDVSRAAAPTAVQPAAPLTPGVRPQSNDSFTLSATARSMAAAHTAVQNAPDVRQQKVTEIKQQVGAGTYQVPASVLARNMLAATSLQV